MNKLQLYIAKSLRGYKSLVNFNPDEDVRSNIRDLRSALATIDYDPLEKNIFYLIEYIADGTLFSIIRTIPTEPLDHLAATIFIPADTAVSAAELDDIVRLITRKMSASGMSADDIAELRRLFARDFPDRPEDQAAAMVASAPGGGYARCLYGGQSGRRLSDYLGVHLYQPAWLSYCGILLLDAELGIGGSAPDLTAQPLATTTPLLPPEPTKEGFEPHIYGRLFDRAFAVPLGGSVEITWKRPGFENRVSVMQVRRPSMVADAGVTDDARKTLSPASFMITSRADRTPLDGCTITVNDTLVDAPRSFTEAELAAANVTVNCPGYTPFSGRIDLAGSTIAHIRLDSPGKIYRFLLPLRSAELGAPVSFEIRSKQPLTQSPVEGYESLDTIREGAGRSNMLAYTAASGAGLRRTLIAAAVGLVVGLLIGFCLFAGGNDEKVRHRDRPADTVAQLANAVASPAPEAYNTPATPATADIAAPVEATSAPQDSSLASAIKYLDDNRSWNRVEMERHSPLAGLFDDMNEMRLDKLISTWGPKLKDSKNFGAVVRAAESSLRKKVNLHRDKRTTYNKAGDNAIGYVGYTYWIDP